MCGALQQWLAPGSCHGTQLLSFKWHTPILLNRAVECSTEYWQWTNRALPTNTIPVKSHRLGEAERTLFYSGWLLEWTPFLSFGNTACSSSYSLVTGIENWGKCQEKGITLQFMAGSSLCFSREAVWKERQKESLISAGLVKQNVLQVWKDIPALSIPLALHWLVD